ncbi:MAG TPA: alpha-glucuronidase, partial [Stenotrophomonas sp.]|nr:alpha-glucuronidase [Stenotrophomonas sp.]
MACTGSVRAEDGYALWMRYAPLEPGRAAQVRARLGEVVAPDQTPTQRAAREELVRGLSGLLGRAPRMHTAAVRAQAVVLGTPQSSALIAAFGAELESLGEEGYLLRRAHINGREVLLVAAPRDIGVLYGV